jgi:hypothetical protein
LNSLETTFARFSSSNNCCAGASFLAHPHYGEQPTIRSESDSEIYREPLFDAYRATGYVPEISYCTQLDR